MDEPEEILDVVLPSGDEAAEVVHPGEEPFHFPALAIESELPSILRLAPPAIGGDQVDVVLLRECLVERVGVVGFVSD